MMLFRNIVMALLMLVTLAMILLPLLITSVFSQYWAYRIGVIWNEICVFLMRFVGGISYKVHGVENMPTEPSLICVKHQSMLDMFYVLKIFGKQSWALKKEMLKIPLFGWCVAAVNPVAIDRKKGKRALDQMREQVPKKFSDGYHFIMYPEGTRVDPFQHKKFKSGAVILAKELGILIVPVAHNAGLYWHKKKWIIHTGIVDFEVMPAIDVSEMTVDEASEKLQNTILNSSERLMAESAVVDSYRKNYLS